MKKEIKDLTLEEMFDFCKKHNCINCQIHYEESSKVIPDFIAINCPLNFIFKNINKSILEREVEVNEQRRKKRS